MEEQLEILEEENKEENKTDKKNPLIGKLVRIKNRCQNWRDKNKSKLPIYLKRQLFEVEDVKSGLVYLKGVPRTLPLKKDDLEIL